MGPALGWLQLRDPSLLEAEIFLSTQAEKDLLAGTVPQSHDPEELC